MNKGRRKFNAAFKAKVAVEALMKQLTLAELAEKYYLYPTQITEWKKQLLSGFEQVFNQGKKADSEAIVYYGDAGPAQTEDMGPAQTEDMGPGKTESLGHFPLQYYGY